MVQVKKTQKDSTVTQLMGLFFILLMLMALSTIGTLIAVGVINIGKETPPVSSLYEAESICNSRVKEDYGDSLNAMTVDDFSSRYDQKTGRYLMFYELDVYQGKNKHSGVNIFYVSCYISAQNGDIDRMEYLEQEDFKPKAIRRTHGNAFGL